MCIQDSEWMKMIPLFYPAVIFIQMSHPFFGIGFYFYNNYTYYIMPIGTLYSFNFSKNVFLCCRYWLTELCKRANTKTQINFPCRYKFLETISGFYTVHSSFSSPFHCPSPTQFKALIGNSVNRWSATRCILNCYESKL